MSSSAKADPAKFFVGIDANAKPLEKLSTKITRKPAKGGLPNAMFVQAAAEDLPDEFSGIASEIYVNFPWGSLLRAVAVGDADVLGSFYKLLAASGTLTVTIGVDPLRDRAELERLGIPSLDAGYFRDVLVRRYEMLGFACEDLRELDKTEWPRIETSWARKLGGNEGRKVFRLRFVRN